MWALRHTHTQASTQLCLRAKVLAMHHYPPLEVISYPSMHFLCVEEITPGPRWEPTVCGSFPPTVSPFPFLQIPCSPWLSQPTPFLTLPDSVMQSSTISLHLSLSETLFSLLIFFSLEKKIDKKTLKASISYSCFSSVNWTWGIKG